MIFYEDMLPGERLVVAAEPVDLAEMTRFAEEWDPMPFHTDGSSAPGQDGSTGLSHLDSVLVRRRPD